MSLDNKFGDVTARPYQAQAIWNLLDAMEGGLDPMAQLATGTGKTIVKAAVGWHVAQRSEKSVLFVVHRAELADQLEEALAQIDPDHPPAREQGDSEVLPGLWEHRYVIAMVQSLSIKRRLDRYDFRKFAAIGTDEAHHAKADSYVKIHERAREQNPAIRAFGLSATWVDQKGNGTGQRCGYNHVAYRLGVREAIQEGWLVPVVCGGMEVGDLDFSNIPDPANMTDEEYDEVLSQEEPLHKVALTLIDKAAARQTLAFAAGKKQVRGLCVMLNRYRPGTARYITDETGRDPLVRRGLAQDFRAGLFQRLVNAGIYTEGTDMPGVACAAICRPCHSDTLATQIVGRAMRTEPGLLADPATWHDAGLRRKLIAQSGKTHALVLDWVGKVANRKLSTVYDVLGSEYTPAVRDYAMSLPPAPPGSPPEDPLERLDRAEAEWALIQEEIERRASIVARGVQYRCEEVDLFDPRSRAAAGRPQTAVAAHVPASEKQVWRLVNQFKFREDTARRMSMKAASAVIAKGEKKAKKAGGA